MLDKKNNEIRWIQRFQNFEKALKLLKEAVELSEERILSELEIQGMIQRFEFTHELAWNVIKDYFEFQGVANITGSRDAVREAFNKGLIEEGLEWMNMINSRNLSTHTYDQQVAHEIMNKIIKNYFPLFLKFRIQMNLLKK